MSLNSGNNEEIFQNENYPKIKDQFTRFGFFERNEKKLIEDELEDEVKTKLIEKE